MLSPPFPDREALEPRRVPGLPQCWPGLRRGQPLYPVRARPCPRMRWPRPLPAPPTWGSLSPGLALPPLPTLGSRPRDLAAWAGPGLAGGRDCLLERGRADGEADGGHATRIGLSAERMRCQALGADAGVSHPTVRDTGPRLPCSPTLPNLTGCAPWCQIPGDTASGSWGRGWAVELLLHGSLNWTQCEHPKIRGRLGSPGVPGSGT